MFIMHAKHIICQVSFFVNNTISFIGSMFEVSGYVLNMAHSLCYNEFVMQN